MESLDELVIEQQHEIKLIKKIRRENLCITLYSSTLFVVNLFSSALFGVQIHDSVNSGKYVLAAQNTIPILVALGLATTCHYFARQYFHYFRECNYELRTAEAQLETLQHPHG